MKKSELKEMIKEAWLEETTLNLSEKEEEETEEKIEVEDEVETDEEPAGEEDMEMAPPAEVGISGVAKQVQDNLEAALIAAKELGDQKLIDQIGNSITFFTRTHVVGKEDVDEDFIPGRKYSKEVQKDRDVMDMDMDENIEESYEKNKWLRIAGIKK